MLSVASEFLGEGLTSLLAKWMNLSTTNKVAELATQTGMIGANTLEILTPKGRVEGLFPVSTPASVIEGFTKEQQIQMLPNFQGVVLQTAKEITSRQVITSDAQVIKQAGHSQEIVIDNSIPRLKEWHYDAYLVSTSKLGLDRVWLIKPTLAIQQLLLDSMAKTRQPGWLKDSNGVFHKALITQLTMEKVPNILNAIHIQVSFKEYKPLTMATAIANTLSMVKVVN